MKYWKNELGECGTRDAGTIVPDTISVSRREYDEYVDQMVSEHDAVISVADRIHSCDTLLQLKETLIEILQ